MIRKIGANKSNKKRTPYVHFKGYEILINKGKLF